MLEKTKNEEMPLVTGLREGDKATLNKVYKSYYPVIESLILKNDGSQIEAKDIFQEAVILLYNKLQEKDFKLTCSIKTFLYAISKRLWLKRWHENKTKVFDTEFESEPGDLNDLVKDYEEEERNFSKMEEALSKLGEPCATLLKDFYIDDMSMVEIAEKFGYTNSDNAKNQKYKCLQRLKKLFFEAGAVKEVSERT